MSIRGEAKQRVLAELDGLGAPLRGKARDTFLEFARLVEGFLSATGAVLETKRPDRPHVMYPWKIRTKAGDLGAGLQVNHDGSPGSVMCRFSEPAWAGQYLRSNEYNPFSGKWNHHYFGDGLTPEKAALDFARQLNRVLVDPIGVDPNAPLPGTQVTERDLLLFLLEEPDNRRLETLRRKFAEYSIQYNVQARHFVVRYEGPSNDDPGKPKFELVWGAEKWHEALRHWKPGRFVIDVEVPPLWEIKPAASSSAPPRSR